MLTRAYSLFTVKSIDEDQRIIEGVATTPKTDRMEDIVEPLGAKYKLPIPFLWQHEGREAAIGNVLSATPTEDGIPVRIQIEKDDEPGILKDRLDYAWRSIKKKLVRGLSIGFRPLEDPEPIKGTFGLRWTKWEWLELSAVTIPANIQATITTIKSYDDTARAASGTDAQSSKSPGASGRPVKIDTSPPKAKGKMTITEQITQFVNTRAAKAARMDELMNGAAAKGETLDAQQEEEYDGLAAEIKTVDKHLVRLRDQETTNKAAATAVDGTSTEKAAASRGAPVVTVTPRTEKGIGFARHAMALAICKGNKYEAAEYAQRTWGDQAGEVVKGIRDGLVTKAAVAPGTTTQATFAAPLVITNYITDFLELLRPLTLIGRIPNLRHVPFNVSMPAQTAGGTYKWVGQNKLKPVTNAQYASVTLSFAKASGIIVLTEELVRLSTPSAEAAVRDELLKGAVAFLDGQFVDSTVAAVANVNPASITNGVAGTAASAATMAAARTDIAARVAAFATATYPLSELVILMSESTAFSLGLGLNAVGSPLFPGMTVTGGSLFGIPVVASQAVGNQIVIAHAPSILIADEGGVEIDVSREASVYMDSAPTDPPDATAVLTSLWQANLVGLRMDRWITWGKARSTAVDRITSVAYAP